MNIVKDLYQRVKKYIRENPWTTAAIIGATAYLVFRIRHKQAITELKLNYFLLALKNNSISEVIVQGKNILFKPVDTNIFYMTNASILSKDQLYKLLFLNSNVNVTCQELPKLDHLGLVSLTLSGLLTWKLFNGLHDSPVQPLNSDKKSQKILFSDIYGMDEVKKDLGEIIEYLKDPSKFNALGARLRRGVLLYGPSGTGKTMLAKAVANEANVNFLYQSATEFLEVYVGVGPKRVRDLFAKARAASPCIIFIDELDAVGKRFTKSSMRDNYETNATINQLLVEMDGFEENDRIVVIAATNREKFIETALLRSGRFDLKIRVDLPNEREREGIARLKMAKTKHSLTDEEFARFAQVTDGFCGADIDVAVNECVFMARRKEKERAGMEELMQGVEKVRVNIIKDQV
jgi:cell division protease FtsH